VYDPRQPNDRLLLGMKGTMSEMELSVLRQRLLEALKQKARRGELFMTVAIGYVRVRHNRIEKDPDRRVVEAIALVFRGNATGLWTGPFQNSDIENSSSRDGRRNSRPSVRAVRYSSPETGPFTANPRECRHSSEHRKRQAIEPPCVEIRRDAGEPSDF
jgi:hypothetical protein